VGLESLSSISFSIGKGIKQGCAVKSSGSPNFLSVFLLFAHLHLLRI
jgi:hypothetical protein